MLVLDREVLRHFVYRRWVRRGLVTSDELGDCWAGRVMFFAARVADFGWLRIVESGDVNDVAAEDVFVDACTNILG